MTPPISGFSSILTKLKISMLSNELARDIESLIPSRNPEIGYLFSIPDTLPGVTVQKNCDSFDLTYLDTGLSLIADERIPRLPSEIVVDIVEMRRLGYYISLLNLNLNIRVSKGNLQYRWETLRKIIWLVEAFIDDDIELIHGILRS